MPFSRSISTVSAVSTNSATVFMPMARAMSTIAVTTSWSVTLPARLRMKSPSILT